MTATEEETSAENKAIEELRKRFDGELSPKMYEDTYMFHRFLKARNFNINDAESMLRKHLEWRKAEDIDNISSFKPSEVLQKFMAQSICGYDKDGCPARYIPFGKSDPIGVRMSAKFSDILRTIERELEADVQYLTELQKKIGRKACGCIYIYDMEGLTFAKATDKRTIEDFITFAKIYQDNYPELLKAAIVINASVYFSLPFSIVKSFLGGSIIDKISIYTTDSWKEALLEQFDADQLPAFLGGTKTDPDGNPLCLTTILHGGPVPEKYYIHKSKKSLAQAEGVKKITLSRASFSEEKVEVKEAGSLLEWEFETKCRDIGFGLFYQEVADGEEKITELVPRERIDTEEYAETGMYKCEKAGTYIMLFDNTYSWIRSKEIYYRVTLVSPKEHEARLSA